MLELTPYQVYKQLYKIYGPQYWWPAETPFEIMVGAILTQNTAWENVEKAVQNLKANKSLTPRKIINLKSQTLAKLIRPSGYFNIKAKRLKNFCEWYIANGELKSLQKKSTESLRKVLLEVNGIGPETADDILLYAFHRPVFVIDAYTRRLFQRLGHITGNEHYETLRAWLEKALKPKVTVFNEYHALIVRHAKFACRKKPLCEKCSFKQSCMYSA